MEYIRKAVERARASSDLIRLREGADQVSTLAGQGQMATQTHAGVQLDLAHLESKAHHRA